MAVSAEHLMRFPISDAHETISAKAAILYALSTGYGAEPLNPALLPYHNEERLSIVPSFANVIGHPGHWLRQAGVDWTGVVHAEQRLVLHAPLQAGMDIIAKTRCISVVDRGMDKGAFVTFERVITDCKTGTPLATVTQTDACRFDGGCGSAGVAPQSLTKAPSTAPDITCSIRIPDHAALLYRLNGDWNRLHWDSEFATQAGFDKPILHGLCSFGYAGYLIGRAYAKANMPVLSEIAARFTAVVFPGDILTLEIWQQGEQVQFRGKVEARNTIVLDSGSACFLKSQSVSNGTIS